jgi:hypothetical protein
VTLAHQEVAATEGKVSVVETGDFIVNGAHAQVPIDGGLAVQTGLLHEVCFTERDALSRDLAVVLGAVKCADRTFRRHHGRCWERRLTVTVPVYQLAAWRDAAVTSSLVESLQYLTGDFWHFEFVKRRRKADTSGQATLLASPERRRVFIPFSHGLDSFAQSQLLRAADAQVDLLPVHLRSSSTERTMKSLGRSARQSLTLVPVSAHIDEPKHAEPSFRTRPFLYDGLAAHAAALSGGGQVLIPENGQGSLGGSLVRLGAEAPHRSCHPGFTSRLRRFFGHLTGQDVRFTHPALFQTKGQVLQSLARTCPDSAEWLGAHPSCSYDARHANRNGQLVHCGVCGNCVLRRLSLHSAGIVDPTPYKVSDVHASSLDTALLEGDEARSIKAFKDIARNAARSMQRLADLAEADDGYRVAAEVEAISRYEGRPRSQVRDEVTGLLQQHSREWADFLQHCGQSSWLAELARG